MSATSGKATKAAALLLLSLTGMAVLGACSGSGASSASSDARTYGSAKLAPTNDQAHVPAAPRAAVPSAATGAQVASAPGSSNGAGTSLVDTRTLIRTATITVNVHGAKHVAQVADRADAIAQAVGGEIDADDRTSGRHASATLRLRVPPETLVIVLNRLGKLGAERHRASSAIDVTERVADVNSRVQSARDAIAQLRALYGRSGKIRDLLNVETALSEREANLEALEAQQRTLTRQTAMATITLLLRTAPVHQGSSGTQHQNGFVTALGNGWHGFVAAAAWVAAAFATLLPFLVLLALVLVALRIFGVRLPRPRVHRSS